MTHSIKFNGVKIKLNKERNLYLNYKSHASVQLVN